MAVRLSSAYTLKVSPAANQDLEAIANGDVELLATLKVYLAELKNDQSLLAKLLEDKYGKLTYEQRFTHLIGVGKIREFWKEDPSRYLWSLKFWEVENNGLKIRFVYMYLPSRRWFIVLAAAPRTWDYDPQDALSARIRADYDRYEHNYS